MPARNTLALPLMLLAFGSFSGPAMAYEEELKAYQEVLDRICYAGITPEAARRYQALVEALDRAASGGGRASNFGGPRTPEQAYLDCVAVEPGE